MTIPKKVAWHTSNGSFNATLESLGPNGPYYYLLDNSIRRSHIETISVIDKLLESKGAARGSYPFHGLGAWPLADTLDILQEQIAILSRAMYARELKRDKPLTVGGVTISKETVNKILDVQNR